LIYKAWYSLPVVARSRHFLEHSSKGHHRRWMR
jgi:hypothetical protein